MLSQHTRHSLFRVCRYVVFIAAIAQVMPAYSQTLANVQGLSAESMIVNIAQQLPNLMRLVTAIAYVMGMFFIISGVMKLKHAGESRTMMSHEHHLGTPLIMIGVGAALLYLPTSIQVGMSTFWTTPAPYGYLQQTDQWGEFLADCFRIVQLVGVIAFIRGLVKLSHLGGHGQHGGMGSALTHLIGGIFCINMYDFIQVIMSTLGITVGS